MMLIMKWTLQDLEVKTLRLNFSPGLLPPLPSSARLCFGAHYDCFFTLGVLFVGVLVTRAPLFRGLC